MESFETRQIPSAESVDLRLVFMREGKLAGAAWPQFNNMPAEVSEHLDALMKGLTGSLDEDDQTRLRDLYVAAATKAQVPHPAPDAVLRLHTRELEARLATYFGEIAERAAREAAAAAAAAVEQAELSARQSAAAAAAAVERELERRTVTDAALDLVQRLSSDPSSTVTFDETRLLYAEIGRLAAPLWVRGTEDDFPPAADHAIATLKHSLLDRFEPDRIFDNSTHQYVWFSYEDSENEFLRALLEVMDAYRQTYFAEFPMGTALPADPAERAAEEERRVERRNEVISQAVAAIDTIIVPISRAHAASRRE